MEICHFLLILHDVKVSCNSFPSANRVGTVALANATVNAAQWQVLKPFEFICYDHRHVPTVLPWIVWLEAKLVQCSGSFLQRRSVRGWQSTLVSGILMSCTCHRSLQSNLMHLWFNLLFVQFHSQKLEIVRIKLHHTCLLPSSDSEWFHSTPNALRVGGMLYGHDSFYPRPKAHKSALLSSWNKVVLHLFGPCVKRRVCVLPTFVWNSEAGIAQHCKVSTGKHSQTLELRSKVECSRRGTAV